MRRRLKIFGFMNQRFSNVISVAGNVKFFDGIKVDSGGFSLNQGDIDINQGGININQGSVSVNQGGMSINQGNVLIKGQLEVAGNQHYDATNIAIGKDALLNHNSLDNIAIGKNALKSLDVQQRNIAIGSNVMQNLAAGEGRNTCIGIGACLGLTSGAHNVSLGYQALRANQTGSGNVVVGCQAGYQAAGDGNVMIGYQAGYNETGGNKLYIANSSTSSPLIYGEFPNVRLNVNAANINFNGLTVETTAGALANYAVIEINGTQYKIALYALT